MKNSIESKIIGFDILQVNFKKPNEIAQHEQFVFDLSLEHKINVEKKIVVVIVDVRVLTESNNNELGNIQVATLFEIKDIEKYHNIERNEIVFPKNILHLLNSISISSVRGIMYSEFKGTILQKAVLPIVDVSQLGKPKK